MLIFSLTIVDIPKWFFIKLVEFSSTIANNSEHLKLKLRKSETVCRNLGEFVNSERCIPLVEQRARVHFLFAAPSGPADAAG